MEATELEYVGFWARVAATIIDLVLLEIVIDALMFAFYGPSYWLIDWAKFALHGPSYWTGTDLIPGVIGFFLEWVFPAIAVIAFWIAKQATPGKMAISAKIVDANTGKAASNRQLIGRFVAYFVSLVPSGLGFLWAAFGKRKQGWHDKLAGTVVVRPKQRGNAVKGWTSLPSKLRPLLIDLLVIGVATILVAMLVLELLFSPIVILPVHAPESFSSRGYTPVEMATRISSELVRLDRVTRKKMKRSPSLQ